MFYRTGILKNKTEYEYHYFVKKLINKGDVVIDIGANLGYYSFLFAKWVGEKGHVYAVEPIEIYNRVFMKKGRRYKNITLMPYALGSENKEIELVSNPEEGFLQTGLPHVYDTKTDGRIEEQQYRFKAQMRKASELFANLEKINYIKCDIEGYEGIVLTDMRELIAKHRPIVQVELWEENRVTLQTMFSELGYFPHAISDKELLPLEECGEDAQGDCILIPCEKL